MRLKFKVARTPQFAVQRFFVQEIALSLQLSFMRCLSMCVFWIQNSGMKTLKNTRMPKRRVKLVAKTMQFPVQRFWGCLTVLLTAHVTYNRKFVYVLLWFFGNTKHMREQPTWKNCQATSKPLYRKLHCLCNWVLCAVWACACFEYKTLVWKHWKTRMPKRRIKLVAKGTMQFPVQRFFITLPVFFFAHVRTF